MAGIHESFLRYRRYVYLKLALLLCALSIAAYCWHDPVDGPNGGTWLGYTLGTAGALIIVWLAWLGVRKRRYGGGGASVKGWLSAHVYIGLSLIVIATLHSGFRFGLNVHTLSYALMLLVIASGLYGIAAYARYPTLITANRTQATQDGWLEEILELNDQALKLADQLGPEVHQRVVKSVEHVRIGGGLRQQLFDTSRILRSNWEALREGLNQRVAQLTASKLKFEPDQQSTIIFMAGQLSQGADKRREEAEGIQKLLDVLARRLELVTRLNRDIRLHARLQIWLYVHVPLSFALLAALIAHVASVFIYW